MRIRWAQISNAVPLHRDHGRVHTLVLLLLRLPTPARLLPPRLSPVIALFISRVLPLPLPLPLLLLLLLRRRRRRRRLLLLLLPLPLLLLRLLCLLLAVE